MREKFYILKAMLLLMCLTMPVMRPASSHTFHTSLMRMEYNREEQSVEISLQVFAHDLENILSKRNGKRIRLDKTADAAKLTLAYLSEAINLKNKDGQVKTFSWIGMQSQADTVWLYVETKMPEGLEGAQVRNRIFFDLLHDQVNLVHVKFDGKKADLVFKRGEDFKAITETKREAK
jgi:hypothetical protein